MNRCTDLAGLKHVVNHGLEEDVEGPDGAGQLLHQGAGTCKAGVTGVTSAKEVFPLKKLISFVNYPKVALTPPLFWTPLR